MDDFNALIDRMNQVNPYRPQGDVYSLSPSQSEASYEEAYKRRMMEDMSPWQKLVFQGALGLQTVIDKTNIVEKPIMSLLTGGKHTRLPEWWTEKVTTREGAMSKWYDIPGYMASEIASMMLHPLTYMGVGEVKMLTKAALSPIQTAKTLGTTFQKGVKTFGKKMVPSDAIKEKMQGIPTLYQDIMTHPRHSLDRFTAVKASDDLGVGMEQVMSGLKHVGTPEYRPLSTEEIIHDFVSKEELIKVQTGFLRDTLQKNLRPQELEAITHAIEQPAKFLELASPLQQELVLHWKNISPKIFDILKEKGIMDDFINDYVTHLLPPDLTKTIGTEVMGIARSKLSDFTPFSLPRQMQGTIEEINKRLLKMGVAPMTTDFSDIISQYIRSTSKALNNHQLVENLKMMTVKTKDPGKNLPGLVWKSDVRPKGFKITKAMKEDPTEIPQFPREEIIDAGYKTLDVSPYHPLSSFYVHPDILTPLRAVLEPLPFTSRFMQTSPGKSYAWLGNAMRRIIMANPLIHGSNLMKSAYTSGVNPVKALIRGSQIYKESDDIVKEFILAGGQYPKVSDILQTIHKGAMKQSKHPWMTKLKGHADKLIGINDKILWDGIGRNLSIGTYESVRDHLSWVLKSLGKLDKFGGEKGVKQMAAQFVNDKMGTIPLHHMHPLLRDVSHLTLFAPRWTYGNLDQVLKSGRLFYPKMPAFSGAKIFTDPQLRMMGAYYLSSQLYALTSLYTINTYLNWTINKSLPWQNEPGKEWSIDSGVTTESGNKLYINVMGYLHDYFNWKDSFNRTIVNKLNPVLSSVFQFAKDESDPVKSVIPWPVRTLTKGVKRTIPYSYLWEHRDQLTGPIATAALLGQRVTPGRTLKTQRMLQKRTQKLGGDFWEAILEGDSETFLNYLEEGWNQW